MPWVYSGGSGTPPSYTWFGVNTYNQEASPLTLPSSCAVTQLKVYAAARSSSVSTRLALWASGGSTQVQSATFTMAVGSESVGGQYWYTKSVTPKLISSGGTYWVGLYRNPSGGHIAGTTSSGTTGYLRTNTSSFPNIYSMSSYTADDKRMYAGVFYITAPSAVTSASVSRVSDSKQTITWTRNASSDQPYDNIYIERYDINTGSYYVKATLSGSATSYSDTSTSSNNRYRYRIRAKNTVGYSSYAYTDYISTTPASPADVEGWREGTSVILSWNDEAANESGFTLQRKTSADNITWTSYSTLTSSISANSETYTDTSPANYNYYQLRADTTTYNTLHSGYTESNLVIVETPPDPPTNLSPDNDEAVDIVGPIPITWQHNPVDGSEQTYFAIRFREYGGSWSLYVNKYARTESYSNVNTSSFTVGVWEYQVSTWGACTTGGLDSTGQGDYSDTASFTLSTQPEVTITTPNGVDDYAYSQLTVEWTYTQAESNPQVGYTVILYDENDKSLALSAGNGASTSTTLPTSLENNTNYKVTVRLEESTGLLTDVEEVEFYTDFYTPSQPTIELTEGQDGTVVIEITNPSPSGTEVATIYNSLYRSVDGGVTYELVSDEIATNTTVTDYVPMINGTTYYYVTATSATPSINNSDVESITISKTGEYYINTGDNYSTLVKLVGDVRLIENMGIDTVTQQYEGRNYPVEYKSDKRSQIISFSCDLPISQYDDIVDVINSTSTTFYRDYWSRWFTCSLSKARLTKKDNAAYQLDVVITRTEEGD